MAKTIWIAALVAGASYTLVGWSDLSGAGVIVWKGAGVGLLAIWAAMTARDGDGRLLAAALALGAIGDVLLEAVSLIVGAIAFLAGHIAYIVLFARHRRAAMSRSQRLLGWIIAPATTLIAALLSRDAGVAIYAAGLGSMAALAWTSRFPRYRVGMGAMLFVASDLILFARIGGFGSWELLIWPTYFAGQALIAWGAGRVLAASAR
ncbi:lysoplasmalogenase [Sphingomonas sp. BGYR3]|uniref:lysoplasmalogenase n=1 Tax=Sphingomonas sp. BGYR3 TaxID=2975483 RepID=UPI0021A8C6BB|nr:lysoplasmalogenase [Sphingomonas sp. BGYR3]MDG5487474.1 lysoplasmalogenase [Sphingomonas sp. BGYR3]